jgi:hypothetical protein
MSCALWRLEPKLAAHLKMATEVGASLRLLGLTSVPAKIFAPTPIGADISKPVFWRTDVSSSNIAIL